ncbi:hypothetical protein EVAR_33850_1 [Eumeta japonica]|uniref:Histone-lysine N-methyltransferase SETMAR n=1 Tax=Eumeta variegata TaxID=151549 RepID=A0A4C1VBK4_EUMVA|nr:hypothetical protein EVAR_33850_1 [Eumeta japonica]
MREEHLSTANSEDIRAVCLMTATAKSMTYQQIRTDLGIGMSQVHKIFREHLPVNKLCARWIPHDLTKAQKLRHVNWCREMMQRFTGGDSSAAYDVVTGDERRVYYPLPNKSVQWVCLSKSCLLK